MININNVLINNSTISRISKNITARSELMFQITQRIIFKSQIIKYLTDKDLIVSNYQKLSNDVYERFR